MRVGVMQAASQKGKNSFLEKGVRGAVPDDWEVINFGVFPEEESDVSYVEVALCAGLLLESGAVDCIVTGCSSGQGMALALNSLPGVVCGYTPTPADAFLFGRINGGNAISYPLGLGWGWNGELNFNATVQAFSTGPSAKAIRREMRPGNGGTWTVCGVWPGHAEWSLGRRWNGWTPRWCGGRRILQTSFPICRPMERTFPL